MKEFITVEEALAIIESHLYLVPVEWVDLEQTLGRTLGEGISSDVDIPPFDNSAMDGFAVRAKDLMSVPRTLEVSQEIPAGVRSDQPLRTGTCARIMTGAPIPDGADSVVPVEWTEGTDPVTFERTPEYGNAIRRAGEDVACGQIVFDGGDVITPPVVGMLAALGIARVPVSRPPSCSIITTGNELVPHYRRPAPGQIRNSNGPALSAQVVSAGGSVARRQTARDEPESLRACIERSQGDDIVVLSGGVSVGEYDLVNRVLADLGAEVQFWKVRQRPGKPLLFGIAGSALIFGLPGNPVSSSICFDRYVRTTIGRMLGRRVVDRPRRSARLTEGMRKLQGLRYFARGHLHAGDHDELKVAPTGPQGSGIYSSMARADCIIHLPEDLEDPDAGIVVEVESLTW